MQRTEVEALLVQLAARTKSMRDHKVDEVCRALARVEWMIHVTDDVYRCCVCFAQDTHTPQCLAAKLVREYGEAKGQAQ